MEANLLNNIEITGISHEGKGIGRINGKVVFVEGALPGEIVSVKIIKQKKSFYEGRIDKLLSPSERRLVSNCVSDSKCGGCVYRHVEYKEEVNLKTRIVRETLGRLAGIDEKLVTDCVPSPVHEQYRNKVQYHVEVIDNKPKLGYIGRDFKFFPAIECNLADKDIVGWAKIIEKYLPSHVTRVIIRKSYPEGKLLCLLLSTKKIKLDQSILQEMLSFPNASAIFGNITSREASNIVGEQTYKLLGEDYLIEKIKDLKFAVGPTSFFQVNPYQIATLYDIALDFLPKVDNLLDLFCGVGSITLFAAAKANQAFGIEISKEAIEYAKFNAEINNILNTKFVASDVNKSIDKLQEHYSAIILDPPRKGCDQDVLLHIAERTEHIIYVSCESSTLARDIKLLKNKGFELIQAIPVDMFPRTAHVECVIMMTKCGSDTKK